VRFGARISTELLQLHSRYFGKGPSKARTEILDDLIVCFLRDAFTTAERTLLAAGEDESVRESRAVFHRATDDEFRGVVERASGRRVVAHMSSIHFDPDISVELFVLEPSATEEALFAERLASVNGHGIVARTKGLEPG
jgi:uncharacterized protein YbcI